MTRALFLREYMLTNSHQRHDRLYEDPSPSSPFSIFSVAQASSLSPSLSIDASSPVGSYGSSDFSLLVSGKDEFRTAGASADSSLGTRPSRWLLSTDRICPRPIFEAIIQDWVELQYPLTPLVHLPTFINDMSAGREVKDAVFFSLLISMCASIVGNIPRIFHKYQSLDGGLPYDTRSDMVNHCQDVVMQLRGPDYFDQSTHEKWSIAFFFGIAQGNLGYRNRSMIFAAETDHHIRQIEAARASNELSLSNVEMQLHKKALCLTVIAYLWVAQPKDWIVYLTFRQPQGPDKS